MATRLAVTLPSPSALGEGLGVGASGPGGHGIVDGLVGRRSPLSVEAVQAMGVAVGLDIDAERVPVVQTFLTELLDMAATLEVLELDGVEPDSDDPRAGW